MRGCVDAVRAARHPRQSTLALTVADRQYASHASLRRGCQPFAGTQVSRVLRCRESDPGYDHIMSTDELSFDREACPSCHLFVFTTFPSRSMASAPVLTRAWRHPSGMPATGWCGGSRAPVHSTSCKASKVGAPASTMPSRATGGRASAWRSWGATSSARSAGRGPTRSGRAGGQTARRRGGGGGEGGGGGGGGGGRPPPPPPLFSPPPPPRAPRSR